jgi:hypothetical protein
MKCKYAVYVWNKIFSDNLFKSTWHLTCNIHQYHILKTFLIEQISDLIQNTRVLIQWHCEYFFSLDNLQIIRHIITAQSRSGFLFGFLVISKICKNSFLSHTKNVPQNVLKTLTRINKTIIISGHTNFVLIFDWWLMTNDPNHSTYTEQTTTLHYVRACTKGGTVSSNVCFSPCVRMRDRPKQQGGNISSSWWQFERRKQGPNNGWMETDHTTLDTRNQWNNQNIQRRKNKGCMLHLPPQRTHTHDNARRTHPLRPRSPRVQFWVIRFDTTLWRRDSSDASLTESVKFGSVNCKFVSL